MRRRGQNRLRILREPWLQKEVDEGFRKAWSAEQIAGRLRLGPVRKPISFNAIYRYFRRLVESGSEKLKDFPRRPAKRRRKRISLFGPLGKKPVCDRLDREVI
jgi:IS30 family transposase